MGLGNRISIISKFLILNEGLSTISPSAFSCLFFIKFLTLLLEIDKLFSFNSCFVGSHTLIASVTQVSSLSNAKLKSFTTNKILIGTAMFNISDPKTEKASYIASNIKTIKIIAIVLALLIIVGLILLFWGLSKNYSKLNKTETINKTLKDRKEFINKLDFNEPTKAQLISSSLGANNEILLRYLYNGKNTLIILDVKTKKIKSIVTIKKGQNSFKINK